MDVNDKFKSLTLKCLGISKLDEGVQTFSNHVDILSYKKTKIYNTIKINWIILEI